MTDLGERPTPEIEPAEPPPGGVDAVEEREYEPHPVVPDLSRVGNPESKDEIPEEVTEPTETDQGASNDGASDPDEEMQA
ncbi:MAG: hypothetical protein J2P22_06855 [Nocardioides sp.]|nr:hypothetical protein [Nocardioides sp.]